MVLLSYKEVIMNSIIQRDHKNLIISKGKTGFLHSLQIIMTKHVVSSGTSTLLEISESINRLSIDH